MCQAWKEILEDCEKKGEICAVYKNIKQGLLTVEQAAKSIGLTKKTTACRL